MEQSVQVPFYRSEQFRMFSKKVDQLIETVHNQQQTIESLVNWLELARNELAWIRLTIARKEKAEVVAELKANNEPIPITTKPAIRRKQKKSHIKAKKSN
jgi:hypothetical protein